VAEKASTSEPLVVLGRVFEYCRWLVHFTLTIPLRQYDSFIEKLDPSSPAFNILATGCHNRKAMRGGYFEDTVKILCVKEEAVLILQLAEKLCPEIISSISRDWSE
jgi:hypothetical protein